MTKTNFFHPYAQYQGKFTPEALLFNANLQEFSQRVNLIVALETGGKITPQDAFAQIEQLWEQLAHSLPTT